MKIRALALALVLVAGCDDNGAEKASADKSVTETDPAPTPSAPDKTLSGDELRAAADQVALVPSPAEMERSLAHAGVGKTLASMVSDRKISMAVDNKDQLAVRAGVVLADLVLTVKDSPKERTVARLTALGVALDKLGAGKDVQATIEGYKKDINNDVLGKDELIKEFDELSQVMVPELKYEAGDWVVPLIQAGSWLEGAHLVSGAVVETGKFDAADNLLRQPAVVDYFIKYVDREGADKAPDKVVAKLRETLTTLKTVASKPTLSEADVKTVHEATGAVLSLL